MSFTARRLVWEPPSPSELARWPLPHQSPFNRWLARGLCLLARRQVLGLCGIENVHETRDPFILAINHSTRNEALFVPTLLILARGGRLIHFLADWNYRLIPGLGLVYRCAETITVPHKSARPRVLNLLRPLYAHPPGPLAHARKHLLGGRSVGIFPEARVNRDPRRLLTGQRGAAFLSLATGVPVVPAGIRFPAAIAGKALADDELMEVRIGAPLFPPAADARRLTRADVRMWHATVMSEIARLSGKSWTSGEIGDEQN